MPFYSFYSLFLGVLCAPTVPRVCLNKMQQYVLCGLFVISFGTFWETRIDPRKRGLVDEREGLAKTEVILYLIIDNKVLSAHVRGTVDREK